MKNSDRVKSTQKTHQDGIFRLHERFINADLRGDVKLSILLPREEHFSKLLIQDIHHKIHYCRVLLTSSDKWIHLGQLYTIPY